VELREDGASAALRALRGLEARGESEGLVEPAHRVREALRALQGLQGHRDRREATTAQGIGCSAAFPLWAKPGSVSHERRHHDTLKLVGRRLVTAKKNIVQRRPAETATPVAMAVAMLIGRAFDLDADAIGYVAIVVAFVPAGVSWLVDTVRS
jgi:hypothetical protein